MKTNVILLISFVVAISCGEHKKKPITRLEDYACYLTGPQLVSKDPVEEALKFWSERLERNGRDETSMLKLASLHAELFKSTGLVDHILLSDSLYHAVLQNYPNGHVDVYHNLSSNSIAQHKFHDARMYAEKALALKDEQATSLLLLVDAALEIGDYAKANQILLQFKNKRSFAYLIRKAKLADHEGMIDSAIACMEKAYQRIKGNKTLSQWALSNLGDMYGHAGRIDDSYDSYLEVLKNDPRNDYALKGVAWIALSHDHKFPEAKSIVNALAARKFMPEAHLMLAEIAEQEGDSRERRFQLEKFKLLVSRSPYKTLYSKYLALLEAEEFNNADVAVKIAKEEIANRPTPQSYDLLAWAYYHERRFKDALEIALNHVEHQTFEPEALYHLGMIYRANGNKKMAEHYLSSCLESEFELGPSVINEIKKALQDS